VRIGRRDGRDNRGGMELRVMGVKGRGAGLDPVRDAQGLAGFRGVSRTKR
jgi:hypothetical protein